MRLLKKTVFIILVILTVAYVATAIYQGSSERKDPPTISCPSGVLEVSATDDEATLLSGITAFDSQDGDLTSRVIIGGISKLISKDTAKVTYMVFDSDDNMGMCTRYIRYVDYHRPKFDLLQPLNYSSTSEVVLIDRLVATDIRDGDISNRIRVSTLATTDNSEVFDITIQVTNSMGDTSWLRLPVLVQPTNPLRPVIELSNYLIYTDLDSEFDPSAYVTSITAAQETVDVSQVTINSNVDTSKDGTYRVIYTYSANGSTGTAILTVVVE